LLRCLLRCAGLTPLLLLRLLWYLRLLGCDWRLLRLRNLLASLRLRRLRLWLLRCDWRLLCLRNLLASLRLRLLLYLRLFGCDLRALLRDRRRGRLCWRRLSSALTVAVTLTPALTLPSSLVSLSILTLLIVLCVRTCSGEQ
jgi:hypothetical protein